MSVNNKNDGVEDITPYIEALSFFENINEITNNDFPKIDILGNNPMRKFIKDFRNYVEINKNDNAIERGEKEYIQKSPQKIFYFFLDELHKLFKDNKDDNKIIKAPEYDRKKAIQYFREFRDKDKSIISDLFFGTKLIIKNCRYCNMTQYDCRYLKVIPLDIINLRGKLQLELEEHLYKTIISTNQRDLFCQMCSNTKEFNVKIGPIFKPKYLIIIISHYQPGTEVKIPYHIFNGSYYLVSAEVGCDNKGTTGLFGNPLKSKNKKNYKFFYNNKEFIELNSGNRQNAFDRSHLPKGNPYVLFYKKSPNYQEGADSEDNFEITQMDINPTQNDKTADIINYEKNNNNSQFEINKLNNRNQIASKTTNPSNSLINNNFSSVGNQPDPDSNEKLTDSIKKITLIFKLNDKEFEIETDDCQPFKNIIAKLIDQYKLNKNDIFENDIYYCNKKIKFNETPRDLGIEDDKEYIYIR